MIVGLSSLPNRIIAPWQRICSLSQAGTDGLEMAPQPIEIARNRPGNSARCRSRG